MSTDHEIKPESTEPEVITNAQVYILPTCASQYLVNFTKAEIEELIFRLPSISSTAELLDRLDRVISHHNYLGQNVWFVNAYDVERVYGGPEEGGWWYDIVDCTQSTGYACPTINDDGILGITELTNAFIDLVSSENPLDDTTEDDIKEALTEHGYYAVYMFDKPNGQCRMFCIESRPAAQQRTERQHYC